MIEFKEPLPDAEQHKLAIKAKTDPKAREKLILHNLRLAYWVALKYHIDDKTEVDDLFQLAVLGLMKAVEKFEPNRGAKFSTVAIWYMRKSISRNMITLSDHVSLDELVSDTEDITLKDTLCDETALTPEDKALNSAFMEDFIEEFRDKLSNIQLKSVLLKAEGYTFKDIALMYDMDPETVRKEREKALRTIRRNAFIRAIWREVDRPRRR